MNNVRFMELQCHPIARMTSVTESYILSPKTKMSVLLIILFLKNAFTLKIHYSFRIRTK
jgi:hypothetical protein